MDFEIFRTYKFAHDDFLDVHENVRKLDEENSPLKDLSIEELQTRYTEYEEQIADIAFELINEPENEQFGPVRSPKLGWYDRIINVPGLGEIRLVVDIQVGKPASYYMSFDTKGDSPFSPGAMMIAPHGIYMGLPPESISDIEEPRVPEETKHYLAFTQTLELQDSLGSYRAIGGALGMKLPPHPDNN